MNTYNREHSTSQPYVVVTYKVKKKTPSQSIIDSRAKRDTSQRIHPKCIDYTLSAVPTFFGGESSSYGTGRTKLKAFHKCTRIYMNKSEWSLISGDAVCAPPLRGITFGYEKSYIPHLRARTKTPTRYG